MLFAWLIAALHSSAVVSVLFVCTNMLSGAMDLCDDVNLKRGECYFDRSPRNFEAILGLYRTGKLHLSQGVSKSEPELIKKCKLWLNFDRFVCKTFATNSSTGA